MRILGIETSCDETAAAVIEVAENKTITPLSNVTATSLALHAETGGIIPEIAARNQIKDIIPVIYEALAESKMINDKGSMINIPNIDSIALTYGPGLIGSLLVGVETAKTLSYMWNKPIIPVNHLLGHIYANFIDAKPEFPAIGLIVSGGHTDLLLMRNHADIVWLGGTRDDAAGEAFDKIGRMLGLAYPAGPKIEELAKKGNPKAFHFPRPLMYDKELDFSFSGLKTAILRKVQKLQDPEVLNNQTVADICRCTQDAIIDVLVYKTLEAAKKFNVRSIILGGGVAANQTLRENFQENLNTKYQILNTKLFAPVKNLCTDNAAMIAVAAVFQGKEIPWQEIAADPELYFE